MVVKISFVMGEQVLHKVQIIEPGENPGSTEDKEPVNLLTY